MLNHRGGRVLFGVEPDGRIIGQMVSDHTIEEVAQELKQLDPPVFPTIDRVDVAADRQVLVVTVGQGSNRPYTYKGKAYRRVGNTSPELSGHDYQRMLLERLHGRSKQVAEVIALPLTAGSAPSKRVYQYVSRPSRVT